MALNLRARGRTVGFPRRPLVMGIVNLSGDSFSGDGLPDPVQALRRAGELADAGADIVDVGAETARTGRRAISEEEEIARLQPFLQGYREAILSRQPVDAVQLWPPLLSVNTWRPEVAAAALEGGAEILNDIGGLPDGFTAERCAEHRAALVIMHTEGEPKRDHRHVRYRDLWGQILEFFDQRIACALAAGLPADRIILDPGIDFAKSGDDNLRILAGLERLTRGRPFPVLFPVSRKTVIGEVLELSDPAQRDAGTAACLTAGWRRGAAVFRVHEAAMASKILRVLEALEPGQAFQLGDKPARKVGSGG
ncbi:MAG TPA: dihydropteroate synthase [Verrucomicrobiales bacterium]|nr:dihydropteroate synthase [Verrucomicrobiales bacterium]